jgi:hypothetical protein
MFKSRVILTRSAGHVIVAATLKRSVAGVILQGDHVGRTTPMTYVTTLPLCR